ncbi:SPOR domain-containing protein [Winogradskyella sp. 3972H.M.0a.05]|uniref:SPOR domain-containing protein n=1 Tax=Winogradskyella sp. 3972H.M.0a.05 TaxID=2950277 RepID=UPI003397356F
MKKFLFKIALVSLVFIGFQSQSFGQTATVNVEQDKDIDRLLEYKRDLKTVETYKIQVFSGNRASAERVMTEFRNRYGEWPVSREYRTPNYKIWVGNFTSRLEADRALMKIKKKYANAFIFKPKKDKK